VGRLAYIHRADKPTANTSGCGRSPGRRTANHTSCARRRKDPDRSGGELADLTRRSDRSGLPTAVPIKSGAGPKMAISVERAARSTGSTVGGETALQGGERPARLRFCRREQTRWVFDDAGGRAAEASLRLGEPPIASFPE